MFYQLYDTLVEKQQQWYTDLLKMCFFHPITGLALFSGTIQFNDIMYIFQEKYFFVIYDNRACVTLWLDYCLPRPGY